jgi:hypothetical protein
MGLHRAFGYLALFCLSTLSGCQQANDDTPGAAGASGGSDERGSSGGGAGGTASSDSGGAPALRGSVVVSMVAPSAENEGYSAVLGRFFDGPTPPAIPLELDSEQGDCKLLVPSNPFCDTPCAPDVCTADDVCTKYPTPLAVGSLTLEGLGDTIQVEPSTSKSIYQSPSLPYPPCSDGSTVTASAADFTLEAECILPLELSGPDPIPVAAGEPVRVTWEPAPATAHSRIRIGLDLAHHGGKKGEIDCEVPDTGSFEIPEPLVTKLVGLGLAGYPTISVSRVSVGTDARLSDVVLLMSQSLQRAVDTGVESCQEDVECTAPKLCGPTRTCQ